MYKRRGLSVVFLATLVACGGGGGDAAGGTATTTLDLKITPSADADARSSYSHSMPDIRVPYSFLPAPSGVGNLRDAVAYLDADGDGDTDVFMATGEYLLQGEVGSFLALNNGGSVTTWSTAPAQAFGGELPPATHARKSITSDFDNDGLADLFVFDHGYDASPFPGAPPKLIMQTAPGVFAWQRMPDTGFHHGGAAADIDNDGDIDIFVGGFDPFFYVNDGQAHFSKATDRFDGSMDKVFSAELIDVDRDGFVDLLIGAHERDGDVTAVYWGNSTGAYTTARRTTIPAVQYFGAVLDFDAQDIDADGDRDLILNRTRDGNDGPGQEFYIGRTIQILENQGGRQFADATATRIDLPEGVAGLGGTDWFPWLRAQDHDGDGDIDLFPDNLMAGTTGDGRGLVYLNDGSGVFTLAWVDIVF